jgi:hypothetical protein
MLLPLRDSTAEISTPLREENVDVVHRAVVSKASDDVAAKRGRRRPVVIDGAIIQIHNRAWLLLLDHNPQWAVHRLI